MMAQQRTPDRAEALELLLHGDLLQLGQWADSIRRRLHPGNRVTFVVDRNVNYTNVCESRCSFCAFYRDADAPYAYLLDHEAIFAKIAELVEHDGTQLLMQGGLHPSLTIAYFEELFSQIGSRFPTVQNHSLSPAEICHLADREGMSVLQVLTRLQAAGLASVPGGGAEILVDEIRKRVSPKKIMTEDWLQVMETAHSIGMESTATMVIGLGETMAQRVEHMERIRRLQDKTGGFRAFITWSYQPGNTELGGEKTSGWDYMRTLAVSRLYMDNIAHIQGSWVTQGERIGQLTLGFGADDLGSIMLEENVVRAAGTAYDMSISKMVGLIRGAGRLPAQRDTEYNIIKCFEE